MRKKLSVLFLVVFILGLLPVLSVSAKKPLIGHMELSLVLDITQTPYSYPPGPPGTYLVTWEGKITFEDDYYMRFFLVGTGKPGNPETGKASHFGEIWEIWTADPDEGGLPILLGTDEGLTNVEKDLTWKYRMNGIVKEAFDQDGYPKFSMWAGRNVHMSGTIEWLGEPFAIGSEAPGIYRIN
ncbi:MAG: hypothetical protein ACFFB5_24475 [Promethearchaeota archaeon]